MLINNCFVPCLGSNNQAIKKVGKVSSRGRETHNRTVVRKTRPGRKSSYDCKKSITGKNCYPWPVIFSLNCWTWLILKLSPKCYVVCTAISTWHLNEGFIITSIIKVIFGIPQHFQTNIEYSQEVWVRVASNIEDLQKCLIAVYLRSFRAARHLFTTNIYHIMFILIFINWVHKHMKYDIKYTKACLFFVLLQFLRQVSSLINGEGGWVLITTFLLRSIRKHSLSLQSAVYFDTIFIQKS